MELKQLSFLIASIFLLQLLSNQVVAQIDYEFLTGVGKDKIDTAAFENTQKIIEETKGLMESEIEPDLYYVGPNDKFLISVLLAKPKQIKAIIAPDGNLIIKEVGIVSLKGKSLAESYGLIRNKVRKIFNVSEVDVVLSDIRKFKVIVSGTVRKPMTVPATAMERVSEIIDKAGGLDEKGSPRKIKLLRKQTGEVVRVDLLKFFMIGDNSTNPYVLGGDQIIVEPLSENQSIEISGEIPNEGEYDFVEGDSLSTLIKFGLGFLNSSFLDSVEISRYNNETRTLHRFFIDLNSWRGKIDKSIPLGGDFPLTSGDKVFIRKIANWKKINYTILEGEVKYPGKYAVEVGRETIYDLLLRAGGFTKDASLDAVTFIRQAELEEEDLEMERLHKMNPTDMSEDELRYFQARVREKRGVMSIDFNNIIKDRNSVDNIFLVNKDSIIVPRKKDYINIQGRVNSPGFVSFNKKYTYADYILLAGGYGFRADIDETFITKAKGEQFSAEDGDYVLEPGDVILVPPEKETSFLKIFTEALTITTELVTVFGVVITIVNLNN